MKRVLLIASVSSLLLVSLIALYGCGTNPSSSGGGGGAPFVADIYVSVYGSDEAPDGDGTQAKPFRTIGKAMQVVGTGEVIGVMAGVYTEHVVWTTTAEGVTLRGASKTGTIISGEGSGRCVVIDSVPAPQLMTIESMTIKDGSVPFSGNRGNGIGIIQDSLFVDLKDLVVIDNNNIVGYGAVGIDGAHDSVLIEGCNISNNDAGNGGAIYNNDSTSMVYAVNCILSGNACEYGGGAIYFSDGILTLEACAVFSNEARGASSPGGGGLYINNGRTDLINCILFNNKASGASANGGAMIHQNGFADIMNCTIVSNEAEGTSGGGVIGTGNTKVQNSILWGNRDANGSTTEGYDMYYTSYVAGDFMYNDVGTWNSDTASEPTCNSFDPVFSGSIPYRSPYDLDLTAGSPDFVRTMGYVTGAPHYDYRGALRWETGADLVSIGAFERN